MVPGVSDRGSNKYFVRNYVQGHARFVQLPVKIQTRIKIVFFSLELEQFAEQTLILTLVPLDHFKAMLTDYLTEKLDCRV